MYECENLEAEFSSNPDKSVLVGNTAAANEKMTDQTALNDHSYGTLNTDPSTSTKIVNIRHKSHLLKKIKHYLQNQEQVLRAMEVYKIISDKTRSQ